ncbi:MAG TPA: tetratricopeptide repeat protein [Planctomycetota bacterium]|nr:tetratricopeptide repeat protein [Planctomycetota bacterium]
MLVLVGTVQDVTELLKSGHEKIQNRDYAGAIEDSNRAIEKAPKEWRLYSLRGEAKKWMGDLDGAILDHTKAIELAPSEAGPYLGRAQVRHRKKDLYGAIQDYSEALRRAPESADLYGNRAVLKLESSDYPGAIANCRKALELDPKNPLAHLNLGSAYWHVRDFDAALSILSKVIEIDPRWASGYFMRGMVGYSKGDCDAALKDADRAIELDAKDPDHHYLRACCLMATGNGKEAKAAFDLALKTADEGWTQRRRAESLLSVLPELTAGPSTLPFRRRILEKGRELVTKGETDKAIDILEETLRLDAQSPEAHEALVGALLKRSDPNRGDRRRANVLVFDVVAFEKGLSPQMQRYLKRRLIADPPQCPVARAPPDGRRSLERRIGRRGLPQGRDAPVRGKGQGRIRSSGDECRDPRLPGRRVLPSQQGQLRHEANRRDGPAGAAVDDRAAEGRWGFRRSRFRALSRGPRDRDLGDERSLWHIGLAIPQRPRAKGG